MFRSLRGRCDRRRTRGRRGSQAPGPARRRGLRAGSRAPSSAPWPRTSRQRTSCSRASSLIARPPARPNRSTAWNSRGLERQRPRGGLGADLQRGQRLLGRVDPERLEQRRRHVMLLPRSEIGEGQPERRQRLQERLGGVAGDQLVDAQDQADLSLGGLAQSEQAGEEVAQPARVGEEPQAPPGPDRGRPAPRVHKAP